MSIRIDGGVVVGWSGTSHEIIPNGSVLIDGDAIKSVGTDKSQPADRVIDASGKIVCPGFVNLHVHSQLNVGDYLLTDVTKKDYLAANWFVFGAPLKEKIEPPAPPAVALGRKYALYSALRNGATTVLDPGGGPGALGRLCRHRRPDRRAGVLQSAVSQPRYFHRRRRAPLL